MARYTGPKSKISRRYGIALFGPSKALERKNYPPGMHGPKGSRRKQSEYAIALGEKQKLRHMYGLMERQFRRYFETALRKRGVTGETLLQMLETRLDNVVYRLGFANSRSAARQLVSHGHVTVNNRKVDVSSYNLKPGDAVFVLSVGGGSLEKNVSPNLVNALKYAKSIGATILGIVGRDGGYTATVADACVIVPIVNDAHITPHSEAFQAVIWHGLVSHPKLKNRETKWESVR